VEFCVRISGSMFRSTRRYASTSCRHFFFVTYDTTVGGGLVLLHYNGLFLNWRLEEYDEHGIGECWSLCEFDLYQSYMPGIFFSVFISFLLSHVKSRNIYFIYFVFESLFSLLLVVGPLSLLNPPFYRLLVSKYNLVCTAFTCNV
jgi:hypothetical protein